VAVGKELAELPITGRLRSLEGKFLLECKPTISDAQPSRQSGGLQREYEAQF